MSHSENPSSGKQFILSSVIGFCGGVRKAISEFESGKERYGQGIYVLHELVHNNFVTCQMAEAGALFTDNAAEIPDGAVVLTGAHGVSPAVENSLRSRCTVIDATCPRVKSLHEFSAQVKSDEELILLCKAGHSEAEGILGYSGTRKIYPVYKLSDIETLPELKNPVLLTQTTVSHDTARTAEQMLRARFSSLRCCGSVCNATYQRQEAAAKLASLSDYVIVVGSPHSSNASELVKVVKSCGTDAMLTDDGSDIAEHIPENAMTVGVTAGASTPDDMIAKVKTRLLALGYHDGGTVDA